MIIPPYCPLMSLSNDQPDRTAMGSPAQKRHAAARDFLRGKVGKNWNRFSDSVTDIVVSSTQRIFGF